MGFLDKFKKKDDFDELLKEPEGGAWDLGGEQKDDLGLGNSQPSNDLGLGNEQASAPQQPTGDLALGSEQGSPPPANFGAGDFGGQAQTDVLGLPSQGSGDLALGNEDPLTAQPSNDSLSSNSTTASTLNLNTNYPEPPQPQQQQAPQQQNIQHADPAQEYVQSSGVPKSGHEFDLILTKLDLLKSTLQNFDSRLSNIEQKLYERDNSNRRRW